MCELKPSPSVFLLKQEGDFQGRRPRCLRPSARGRNRARELGRLVQATGLALLFTRATSTTSDSNRRPSRTLPNTHWKGKRVTHITRVRASLPLAGSFKRK